VIRHGPMATAYAGLAPGAQRVRPERCRRCAFDGAEICRILTADGTPVAAQPPVRRFASGEVIFEPGAPLSLGIVRRGFARRSAIRRDGKRILIGLAGPGDIVSGPPYRTVACDLEAASDCEICMHDSRVVDWHMRNTPRARHRLLQASEEQYHRLLGALWRVGSLTSRERILAFLVMATEIMPTESQPDGSLILTMEIDRRDWADFTNTAVETISRTLHDAAQMRLVTRLSPSRLRIHNLARLARLAGVEPPPGEKRRAVGPGRIPACG